MNTYINGLYEGERVLFNTHKALIQGSVFANGESPLKESSDLEIIDTTFKWKYPLWYCHNVVCNDVTILETGRSGVWYTHNIVFNNCDISAPKTFRRCVGITLNNCKMPNALETFWNCRDIKINNIEANGDYFGLNSENIEINNIRLIGNYAFDGGKNIIIRNSYLETKDAFWNCENVTVIDSVIKGEYLSWNANNIKFINCRIESHQGLCYMKNLYLENCELIHSDLCFEYCENIKADIISSIGSIKNPISGEIKAKSIGEIILDKTIIDSTKTKIIVE